ncbi:hypothetical protein [Mycolicibacterium psychrotolerans]|uniref:Uncharacterized protein n=1 Tax=Mycolicibacterium psychrotolerans TaxID=216929 RepID=A0A7I7ME20_9MYCO|nr:hypothetical protein [Mycolicibacterium psychrotolerans]BBX70092.1 hypothetical protein MPSYJ_35530 [Mycolicibacterium psychrotolerans]
MARRQTPPLHLCNFTATRRADGRWVGKCQEFPDLATRPHGSKVAALDAIITATSERLRAMYFPEAET